MIPFLSFVNWWFAVRPAAAPRGDNLVAGSGCAAGSTIFETAEPDLKTIFQIGLHCPKQRRPGATCVV